MHSIDIELIIDESIRARDLRRFIMNNINNQDKLIRWSIHEISHLNNSLNKKKIKINAILIN
tara:strand:+ start:4252 stop:4437 length:186 start_codon:yes stop_codon:yes gene_type:complete